LESIRSHFEAEAALHNAPALGHKVLEVRNGGVGEHVHLRTAFGQRDNGWSAVNQQPGTSRQELDDIAQC
jgi:hypothetical protein